MVSRRKDRQKLLLSDELFDRIGHEYKEDKPTGSSVYTPVKEEQPMEFLDIPDLDLEEPQKSSSNKSLRGSLVLLGLFLLVSLLSIATIVFILIRGGV